MGNRAKPEGTMAKIYAIEETVGFCTKYLVDFTTTSWHRVWDDKKDPSMFGEVLEGGGHPQIMTKVDLWDMACSFVLQNVGLMATWCE